MGRTHVNCAVATLPLGYTMGHIIASMPGMLMIWLVFGLTYYRRPVMSLSPSLKLMTAVIWARATW